MSSTFPTPADQPTYPAGDGDSIQEANKRFAELCARVNASQQARARARIAEKRKAAAALEARSESNKRLAEALGTSVRYVRMLRSDGTTLPETAKTMAAILGGKPESYMRRPRRRGRRADLVAIMMKIPAEECGFTDFVADPPEGIDDGTQEMVAVLQARGARDFQSLEALVAFIDTLEFESVGVESAATVWRAFKIWRIDRIATIARFTANEGAELI